MALKVIGVNINDLLLESVLECPVCGFAKRETTPTGKRRPARVRPADDRTRISAHHETLRSDKGRDYTRVRWSESDWTFDSYLNWVGAGLATHAALSHYAFDAEGRGGPDIQITNGMAAHRLPSTTLPSPTVGWVQKSMVCS